MFNLIRILLSIQVTTWRISSGNCSQCPPLNRSVTVCFLLCKARLHSGRIKPIFHLATLFARREAKTRIRQRDWLKLAGEKIRRKQVGTVLTFLSVRANKFAKWKIGLGKFPLC